MVNYHECLVSPAVVVAAAMGFIRQVLIDIAVQTVKSRLNCNNDVDPCSLAFCSIPMSLICQ